MEQIKESIKPAQRLRNDIGVINSEISKKRAKKSPDFESRGE